MTERVLITGANGFVGQALCRHLVSLGFTVRALVRRSSESLAGFEQVQVSDIAEVTSREWGRYLNDVQVVIHCAALVHQMGGVLDSDVYYRVNTEATATLANAAADNGVRRFVFLSTVKVLGESSEPGRPLKADDPGNPQDDYACSKWLAEKALAELGEHSHIDTVIIRPPLIYGPGVGGNFASLMSVVAKGIPLPFGMVKNRRSLLAIDNLVDFVGLCTEKQNRIGGVYLVSDEADLSIAELITEMAIVNGRKARLLPVPVSWLLLAGKFTGKSAAIRRLCDSLQVDKEAVKQSLDWSPKHSLGAVLRRSTKS